MKLNHLFSALLGIMLTMGFTACEGEKDLNIIEGELPIKTGTLYMVGDATPNGWDIGNPTALQASADDALTFTWEGELRTGELKLCLTTGSWDAPFIRPEVNGTEIGKTDISNAKFAMHAGDPDDKWRVAAAGTYRLTFDLRNWTMSTAFLAEPEAPSKEPILAENVFMVGDATPAGWNIDAPTQLTRQSQYIFIYEGTLAAGEMKAYTQSGDWGAPAIRPTFGGCKIGRSGVESADFIYTTGPDDKWQIEEAGQYRLTFDLEHYTLAAEYLGEIPAQTNTPIEAEAVYIVGDATPNGWSIDAPTQLTKQSQYIFVYEGELVPGELKACTQTGDWGVPFIRPTFGGCKISLSGVENAEFTFTANPGTYVNAFAKIADYEKDGIDVWEKAGDDGVWRPYTDEACTQLLDQKYWRISPELEDGQAIYYYFTGEVNPWDCTVTPPAAYGNKTTDELAIRNYNVYYTM